MTYDELEQLKALRKKQNREFKELLRDLESTCVFEELCSEPETVVKYTDEPVAYRNGYNDCKSKVNKLIREIKHIEETIDTSKPGGCSTIAVLEYIIELTNKIVGEQP